MYLSFQEKRKMKGRKSAFLGGFFTFYLSYVLPLFLIKQKFYRQIPNLMILAGSFSLLAFSRIAPVPHVQVGVSPALTISPLLVVFDHHLKRNAAGSKVVQLIRKCFSRHPMGNVPVRTYNEGPPVHIAPHRKIKPRARSDPVPV